MAAHPVAVYMSRTMVEFSEISFSPIGVRAAWKAGPRIRPSVWKREISETWVVLSSMVVTLEIYPRDAAFTAGKQKKQ